MFRWVIRAHSSSRSLEILSNSSRRFLSDGFGAGLIAAQYSSKSSSIEVFTTPKFNVLRFSGVWCNDSKKFERWEKMQLSAEDYSLDGKKNFYHQLLPRLHLRAQIELEVVRGTTMKEARSSLVDSQLEQRRSGSPYRTAPPWTSKRALVQ